MQIRSRRFSSRAELDAALTQRLEQAIRGEGSGATRPATAIMLSGGHTPLPAYRALARRPPVCDPQLHLLYSDDRYVPADSDSSNYHATRPLLEALGVAQERVLHVRTELPLEQAALDYDRQLRQLLDRGTRVGLGLLGLGADGHTASLFRSADLERARGRLAVAVQRPDGLSGVSVTPEFLSRVAEPLFVVAGGGKFDAIQAFLRQDASLVALQAVQGCERVELWVEQAAEFSLYA